MGAVSRAVSKKHGGPAARLPRTPGKRTTPVPTRPPLKYYDPTIDFEEAAAQRGFGYQSDAAATGQGRDWEDLLSGGDELRRQRDEGLADLDREEGRTRQDLDRRETRGFADLLSAQTRAQQDYTNSGQQLDRNYSRLAGTQEQRGRQQGQSSGIAAKAARVRGENRAWDQKPLDLGLARTNENIGTERSRLGEDLATSRTRLGEDVETGRSRLNAGAERGIGQLNTSYLRGETDRQTGLQQGFSELLKFQDDSAVARVQQAKANQWPGFAPPRPRPPRRPRL